MSKERENEELQSRREFFRNVAKRSLPILGMVVFGPSILSSCEKDDGPSYGGNGGHNVGSTGCKASNCTRTCANFCKSEASHTTGCYGSSCHGHCYASCMDTCRVQAS